MSNTPTLKTKRLLLRRFSIADIKSYFHIMSDDTVNEFLPWFPLKDLEEARSDLQERFLNSYDVPKGFKYAICLQSDNIPIGYVNVSSDDSFDFGYGLSKGFWHKGIVTEACRAVTEQLKKSNIPFITATHDVNNPRSGRVMSNIGMTYRYSYKELWQPKNIWVTFRMYQLNFDKNDSTYRKYWETHPKHFVEENL